MLKVTKSSKFKKQKEDQENEQVLDNEMERLK